MFNIGIGEIVVIALLALIFIGPERLPKIMRQLGLWLYQIRLIANEFTSQYAEELRPLQEFRNLADDLNPSRQIGNLLDPASLNKQSSTPTKTAQENPMKQLSQMEGAEDRRTIAPPGVGTTAATNVSENPMSQITASMQAPLVEPVDGDAVNKDTPVTVESAPHAAAKSPMDQIASAMKTMNRDNTSDIPVAEVSTKPAGSENEPGDASSPQKSSDYESNEPS